MPAVHQIKSASLLTADFQKVM